MTATTIPEPAAPDPGRVYAVLPLRDIVVFPHMVVPLSSAAKIRSRPRRGDGRRQADPPHRTAQPSDDDPGTEDIYRIGTIATVLQLLKLPDGTVKVLVEGVRRARVTDHVANPNFFQARVEPIADELGAEEDARGAERVRSRPSSSNTSSSTRKCRPKFW